MQTSLSLQLTFSVTYLFTQLRKLLWELGLKSVEYAQKHPEACKRDMWKKGMWFPKVSCNNEIKIKASES